MSALVIPLREDQRVVGFDYGVLHPEVAADARGAADRIRARLRSAWSAYIETGADLQAIKDRLGHGHFGKWLVAEFGMTVRTAENYMAAARFAEKYETVSHLPATTLYALASTPEVVCCDLIRRLESGEKIGGAEIRSASRMHSANARWRATIEAQRTKRKVRQRKLRPQEERRLQQDNLRRLEADKAVEELVHLLHEQLGPDVTHIIELLDRASFTLTIGELISGLRKQKAI